VTPSVSLRRWDTCPYAPHPSYVLTLIVSLDNDHKSTNVDMHFEEEL
jgi:hypothetical protein